ncbi:DNA repair exonuclease [Clavulina sp. PMI_390]|nr:DNA repair exonuclease [Clavulina sp. PMI_390]
MAPHERYADEDGHLGDESPDDTIKIMLATDNHIGYLERDPVRSNDAINTFEEILQLAVKHDVDFILLAGDLFHDNRPSRESVYHTTALLRKYTLGDKQIAIELLSDPMESKPPGFEFPAINYEDPNFNVSIPVFSIHGNHDDPQGAGQDGALCALDLLSVSGLLNYFGKTDLPSNDYAQGEAAPGNAPHTVDGITIKPVLLRKGNTKLGMYGIGNIKDTRMHFELMHNRVKMWKPKDAHEFCNLLLIHQNRVKHGPNDAVPETMFDDSMNLVIWGHEHDQRITPEDVPGKNYKVTQPGSSVATSLTEGESIQKYVALLRIQGTQYELEPIPLRTVRPFIVEDLELASEAEDEGVDLTDSQAVMKFIRSKIEELIRRVKERWVERMRAAQADDDEEEINYPEGLLPLIRLRIDTTGVPNMGNPNRIGQEFQGRIANNDPVSYIRSKKGLSRSKVKIDEPELSVDNPDLSSAEKLSRVRVGTLVKEFLAAQELQLLGEHAMSDAVQKYVDKDDPRSIDVYVKAVTEKLVKSAKAETIEDEHDVTTALTELKERGEQEYLEQRKKELEANKSRKGKSKQVDDDAQSIDSMEADDFPDAIGGGDDGDEMETDPPPKKKATSRAAAGSSTTKRAPAKKATTTTARGAAAKAKAPAKKAKNTKLFNESEDDEDEDEIEDFMEEDEEEVQEVIPRKKSRADVLNSQPATKKKAPARKPAQSTSTKAAPARTAAKRTKASVIELSD